MTEDENVLDERQLQDLLRSVEGDRLQTSERRDQILQDVLAHYDSARGRPSSDLIAIVDTRDAVEFRYRASRFWLAAAAIVLPVVVGLGVLARSNTDSVILDPAVTVAPEPEVDADAPDSNRLEFPVGEGSISLDVPSGLVVVRQQAGLLVLAASATETSTDQTLVLIDVSAQDIAERINALAADNEIIFLRSTATVDGQPQRRWEINVTNSAATELGCVPDEPCVELIAGQADTSIAVGIRTEVIEVGTPTGGVLVMVAPTAEVSTFLRDSADAILATIETG